MKKWKKGSTKKKDRLIYHFETTTLNQPFISSMVGFLEYNQNLKDKGKPKKISKRAFISKMRPKGLLPPNSEKSSMIFHNDKLYLFGGISFQSFNDMWIFDIESHSWSKTSPEINVLGRYGHSCDLLKGGEILIFGGELGKGISRTIRSTLVKYSI